MSKKVVVVAEGSKETIEIEVDDDLTGVLHVWQVGNFGDKAQPEEVERFTKALSAALKSEGTKHIVMPGNVSHKAVVLDDCCWRPSSCGCSARKKKCEGNKDCERDDCQKSD